MTKQIKKVQIKQFGDVSNIQVITSEIEDPDANHVQVAVMYSGFSGADINMRQGTYPLQKKAPFTPGYCLVGRVRAAGSGCTGLSPGDLVGALTVYDAESELVNVPQKYIIPIPNGIDPQHATALILDWNTAYGLVIDTAKVSKGQIVFVHGMSGAVGSAIAALCKMQGAEVYGTASERNHAILKELGYKPLVYSNKDWIKTMLDLGGVHAVFDPLGFESWDESYSIVRPSGGRLLGYGGNLVSLNGEEPRSIIGPTSKLFLRNAKPWSKKRTSFYYITRDQSTFKPNLNTLFEWVSQGKITVRIKKIWNMDDIQDAHRQWSSTPGVGSLLIKVSD